MSSLSPRDQVLFQAGNAPFSRVMAEYEPRLLPDRLQLPGDADNNDLRHGTTIMALAFADGIVTLADRQVTTGSMVSNLEAEKILAVDDYTCVGTAGTAALGMDLARLYQVELEHYEKIEGRSLRFEGKANRLSKMLRDNLAMLMQGLAVVPILTGYDEEMGPGRIFSYDGLGGRQEERNCFAIGSGSIFAIGSLKKMYQQDMGEDDAVAACLQAVYDAGQQDVYTMGYDLTREIFPVVYVTTGAGNRRLTNEDVGTRMRAVIDGRMQQPDGPRAVPR